ncbi:MAG: HNH endonuclease [Bdellovibrio sp.]|nr:HNH endonuclease [Bdellovibrio sp.]
MNLKNLKNEVLLQNTKNLIKEENRILAKVLAHFQEIESRKLYLELGYGGLFSFAVKELGYSEAAAQRRIEALRFLKKTPEALPIVEKGNLNLSNLSLLERITKEAQATHAQNVEALNLIQAETTSAAKAENKLREFFKLENKKRVISMEVDEETYQLWLQTKAKMGEAKDAVVLKKLCQSRQQSESKKTQPKVRQAPTARIAGVVLRRELLKEAGHRCQYVSPINARRCENQHFLQCDHKVPYCLGGETTQQNMRVLCQQHNQMVYQNLKSINL